MSGKSWTMSYSAQVAIVGDVFIPLLPTSVLSYPLINLCCLLIVFVASLILIVAKCWRK